MRARQTRGVVTGVTASQADDCWQRKVKSKHSKCKWIKWSERVWNILKATATQSPANHKMPQHLLVDTSCQQGHPKQLQLVPCHCSSWPGCLCKNTGSRTSWTFCLHVRNARFALDVQHHVVSESLLRACLHALKPHQVLAQMIQNA